MNPWAEERAPQLDTPGMTAFGIRIVTRSANAQEMIELIEFARAAAEANVNMFVPEAFYDSGSGCCRFTLSDALYSAGDRAIDALLAVALSTISQFEWFGGIEHGRNAAAQDESP